MMDKIIKITDDKVYVGRDDGSIIFTTKDNVSWDVKIGDFVEVFKSEDLVILCKANSYENNSQIVEENGLKKINTNNAYKKEIDNHKKQAKVQNNFDTSNKKNIIINKFLSKCKKVIFTSLFAFFFIGFVALIVLAFVPRGNCYVFKKFENGIGIEQKIKFSDDYVYLEGYGSDGSVKCKYKIYDRELWIQDETTMEYVYIGDISSTKIIAKTGGLSIEYVEETLNGIKITSIIFAVVSSVLMIVYFVLVILYDKGIIKGKLEFDNFEAVDYHNPILNNSNNQVIIDGSISTSEKCQDNKNSSENLTDLFEKLEKLSKEDSSSDSEEKED